MINHLIEIKVDLLNSTKHPFITLAQSAITKQMITMPMASFHQLAEKVGNPRDDQVHL